MTKTSVNPKKRERNIPEEVSNDPSTPEVIVNEYISLGLREAAMRTIRLHHYWCPKFYVLAMKRNHEAATRNREIPAPEEVIESLLQSCSDWRRLHLIHIGTNQSDRVC